MQPSRNSLILSIVAVLIILFALAIRIAQFTPHLADFPPVTPLTSAQTSPIVPSSSFYAGQNQPTAPAAAPEAPPAPAPQPVDVVTAEAYLVGNVQTGKIYLEHNPSEALPLASLSKLFTAIAATDTIPPTATIEITPAETQVPPDPSGLQAGERFTLSELLYPMLLDSSNVAAEAVASSTDRNAFLGLMSSYAHEIGASTATFQDPTGLDAGNAASADDLFALAKYLYTSRPDILAITRTASTSVATTTDHGAHRFVSIQPFVSDPRFIGGKTGFTYAADQTMLTILNIGGQPMAFIILHSDQQQEDTDLLISKTEGMID